MNDAASGGEGRPTESDTRQEVPVGQPEREYTPEEVKQLKAAARKLMEGDNSDKYVIGACINLVAARRLYQAALVDLNERLKELKLGDVDGVRQILEDAMRDQGGQPFTRQLMLEQLQRHVLPWVMATIQSERAREAAEEARREKALDEERRRTPVPIGFAIEPDLPDDPKLLERERTLTLAGHPGAVKYLLRRAAHTALLSPEDRNTRKLRVIHLSCYESPHNQVYLKGGKGALHLTIGLEQWKEQCTTFKAFSRFMLPWCKRMRHVGVDLLLVDDLRLLGRKPASALPVLRAAAETHRQLRRWADAAGCGVIVGLPCREQPGLPQLTKDWDQLEVYTNLRRIELQQTEEADEMFYRIRLDNGATPVELVDPQLIQNYKGSENGNSPTDHRGLQRAGAGRGNGEELPGGEASGKS